MPNNWDARSTYLYLVCLITLIMAIVAAVGTVRSVVSLAYPEPAAVLDPLADPEQAALATAQQRSWSQRSAVLDLVHNLAMLAIAVPLYIRHWRRIERD
ncbi:MAG: hypothetical protein ACOX2L_11680 [Anaerolineae bacterium]|jgi:hypothetical protein|nr:hypothetical protein [Chloroflexota bacterium]